MILLALSQSAPYLATPHLSLHRIGFKHIPYFALPIVSYLLGHTFAMQLAYSSLGYIGGEVPQRGVLLREHIEPRSLEGHVISSDNVAMSSQMQTIVELSVEVSDGRVRLGECL